MMFNARHHHKAYKKILPKWFGPFVIKKMFINNGSYEFKMLMVHHIYIMLIMTS
jgi:hypothetical protein